VLRTRGALLPWTASVVGRLGFRPTMPAAAAAMAAAVVAWLRRGSLAGDRSHRG
jgi:hypothetical protein